MTNVQMVSLSSHRYGTEQLKKGSPFLARPCDVTLLAALGRAKEVKKDGEVAPPPAAARQTAAKNQTKQLSAAKAPVKGKASKGKYNRRDMRVKG